jgi:hypothetical protein
MPQLEEISIYLKGLWLLVSGKPEGLDWLDLSAIGVWRSFAAILWCLPAMAVSWGVWRLFYLANMPAGTEAGILFIAKLFVIDLIAWIFPLMLIAILARPLNYDGDLAAIIVSSNWLSVPVFYAMAVPAAIRLVVPESDGLTSLLSLIFLISVFAVIFRLMKTITNNQILLASALTLMFTLPSFMVGNRLQAYFGLMPG